MKRKRKASRIVAIITVITMAFIQATPMSFAAKNSSEVRANEPNQIVQQGTEVKAEKDGVTIKKTVASKNDESGKQKENEFNITLEVTTTENLKEVSMSADAAALLLIDTSLSMRQDISGRNTSKVEDQRLTIAKDAANQFIDDYSKVEGTDAKRDLSVASFGTNAVRLSGTDQNLWSDVTSAATKETIKGQIRNLQVPSKSSEGYTNIEGALQLAHNIINKGKSTKELDGISSIHVILLTDGDPTARIGDNSKSGTNEIKGTTRNGADKNAIKAIAKQIRDDGITLHSIQFAANVELLKEISDKVYDAKDASGLSESFAAIITTIQMFAQAWNVTDPMGTDIVYKGPEKVNTGTNNYSYDRNTLTWDLKLSTPTVSNTAPKTYTYQLTYPIVLDTTGNVQEEYPTNDTTTLKYLILKDGVAVGDKLSELNFKVPKVKGFWGGFSFKKQEKGTGKAMSDVKFTLEGTTAGTDYQVGGDNAPYTAVSDGQGIVSFSKIPAGAYTLKEQTPAGYNAGKDKNVVVSYGKVYIDGEEYSSNGNLVIENEKLISMTVDKQWVGPKGQSHSAIEVELKDESGKVVKEGSLGPDSWTLTWNDLPAYNGKVEIDYTKYKVEEKTPIDLYTVSGGTVTKNGNSYEAHLKNTKVISISGIKAWDDKDNQDGKRPAEITVQLKSGDKAIQEVKTTEGKSWEYRFDNVPEYDEDGNKIEYEIDEVLPEGYSKTVKGHDITNKHTPETTELTVTKKWEDNSNQDGNRPDSVTFQLQKKAGDGVVDIKGKTIILSGSNDTWTATFKELPKFENGTEITYGVRETGLNESGALPGKNDQLQPYSVTTDGTKVTNTYTPETSKISVKKIWNDTDDQDKNRPESVEVQLVTVDSQGQVAKVDGKTKKLSADQGWKADFENLPVYNDGQKLQYAVRELNGNKLIAPDGTLPGARLDLDPYKVTYGKEGETFTVTNTYSPAVTAVSGTKTWDDNNNQDGFRPENIKIELKSDVNLKTSLGNLAKAVISPFKDTTWYSYKEMTIGKGADGTYNWTYAFEGLPKYHKGEKINYTIEESGSNLDKYTADITKTENGFDIKNSHTPEQITIKGEKTWEDNDNQDGIRPKSITVMLMNGATEVDKTTTDAVSNWKYSFTADKYRNGTEIKYEVREAVPQSYTAKYDSEYNIENTHEPGQTSFTVTKTWSDDNNNDGKRPESVTVKLYANDEDTGKAAELKADKDWTYTWEGLAEKANGKPIVYTVKELDKSGAPVEAGKNYDKDYVVDYNGSAVTNTDEADAVTKSVEKIWSDAGTKDRPESVTVQLKGTTEAGYSNVYTEKLSKQNDWKHSWDKLPKYHKGEEIKYSLTETFIGAEPVKDGNAAGYISNVYSGKDGFTVVNALESKKEVSKGTDANGNLTVGQKVTYDITYYNTTDKEVTVGIKDTLPKELDFVSASDGGTAAGQAVTWPNKTVSAGGNITVHVTATVNSGALVQIENNAQIKVGDHDPVIVTDTTPVNPEKTVNKGNGTAVKVGDILTYSISYGNYTDAAQDISIKDILQPGLSYIKDSAAPTADFDGDTLTWDLKNVKKGEGGTVTFQAKVTEDAVAQVENSATVQIGHQPEISTNPVKNPVKPHKEVNPADGTAIKVGDTLTYTIHYGNTTDSEAVIKITDQLDSGLTYVEGSASKGGTFSKDTLTWNLGTIKSGEGGVVTFQAEVNKNAVAQVENEAKIKIGDQPEISTNKVKNPVDPYKEISTTGDVKVDDILTYTIHYGNTESTLQDIVVTDELTKGLTFVESTPKEASLDSSTNTVTWKFDKVEPGKGGTIVFKAKVNENAVETDTVKNTAAVKVGDKADVKTNPVENPFKETVNKTVTKVWDDEENVDKLRPETITVQLLADAQPKGDQVVLSAKNNWSHTWKYLDKYTDNTSEIKYTVKEISKTDGYDTVYSGDTFTITNFHLPDQYYKSGEIKAVKKVMANGKECKVTDSFYIGIFEDADFEKLATDYDGKNAIRKVELKGQSEKSVTFDNLAVGPKEDPVKYYVTEVDENGIPVNSGFEYDVTVEKGQINLDVDNQDNSSDPAVITNTFDNMTKASGVKSWNNDTYVTDIFRPDSIEVQLLQNGKNYGDPKKVKPDAEGNWNYTFDKLPKFDQDGKLYQYTVNEAVVDGYATTAEGMDLTNSLEGYLAGSVNITKKVTLNGKPYDVTGVFYAGIFTDPSCKEILKVDQDGNEVPALVALPVDGTKSGKVTVDGLPLGAGGEPVKYYIAETDSQGNAILEGNEFKIGIDQPAVTVDAHGTKEVNITNDYSKKAALTGTKTWEDDNDASGLRPGSIKVTLLQNGKVYRDPVTGSALVKTISAKDNWTYSFVNLPEKDDAGENYTYSVMETGAEADYDTTAEGMNLTNTLRDVEQYYYEGTIDITKKTMLRDKAYKVDDVYYAGIFEDKNYTKLLTDEDGDPVVYAIALDDASKATISVPVPVGANGETVTYYVTEVDEYGTPVSKVSGLQYTSNVKNGVCAVAGGETAKVTFINSYQVKKVPQTGDDSNILWLILLVTLAAIAMIYIVLRRKTGQYKG